jgi:beta-lactamase superfamily II metal-dependent hydrolase
MANSDIRFAGFPSVVVYGRPVAGKKVGDKPVQHLLWGDWLKLKGSVSGDWLEIRARGVDGWIHKDQVRDERLLEFTFVDVGQGDGCLITTPGDQQIIVDAGQDDNMFRFLRWRFGEFRNKFTFQSAIISHPDSDHYQGFKKLFDDKNVWFGTIFHNGIIERDATVKKDSLGQVEKIGKIEYLTDIVKDSTSLNALSSNKQYAKMLKKALESGRMGNIQMLSTIDGYLPGYGLTDPLHIQVLGPVPEQDKQGKLRLRWFGDVGKTKNGNSIVLRIGYKNVSVLLGSDLNSEAEYYLLSHYTGLISPPEPKNENRYIELARKSFESDVEKSCHHGSSDFTEFLLQAVNPAATVISSGDDEPYSHPRADALGTIGRFSRGSRPLIFSTELARSTKENIKHPYELKKEAKKLAEDVIEAKSEKAKQKAQEALNTLINKIDRSIAVYGAINLRTDGNDIVIAQKIESPRRNDKKWDIYVLKRQKNNWLQYDSKYK